MSIDAETARQGGLNPVRRGGKLRPGLRLCMRRASANSQRLAERLHAELRQSEERYRLLFESGLTGIMITRPDGSILAANPEACRLLGRSEEEICAAGRDAVVNLADPRLAAALEERARTGRFEGELSYLRADGSVFPVGVVSSVVADSDGREYSNIFFRDITAPLKAAARLRESEERLRQVLEHSLDASYKRNLLDDSYEYLSPVFERITGYDVEVIKTQPLLSTLAMVHPEDMETVQSTIGAAGSVAGGDVFELEYRFRHRDGSYRWLHDSFVVLRDGEGRALSHIGSVRDISARKRAEGSLQESEQKRRRLFETLSQGVIYYSSSGAIVSANPAATRILGICGEQLFGKPYYNSAWDMILEDGSPLSKEDHPISVVLRTGKPVEGFVLGMHNPATGARQWLSVSTVPIFNPGERSPFQVYSTFEDISARRIAEEAIASLAQRNQTLLAELQHRAKNSFNMIQGMISYASSPDTSRQTKEALQSLGARVACVSELYSILYAEGSTMDARLDEYCSRIAAPLVGLSRNVMLDLDLEPMRVAAKSAAPIGLVLTELVTNAVKYAFPEGREGRIRVSLTRQGQGAVLEVSDDGVGMRQGSDSGTGMGLKLIRGLAAQIEGSFRIGGGAGGTKSSLEIPLVRQ